jgi:hypothetical protein
VDSFPDLPPGHPCRGQTTACLLDGPTYSQQLGDKLSDTADSVSVWLGPLIAWLMMFGMLAWGGFLVYAFASEFISKRGESQ